MTRLSYTKLGGIVWRLYNTDGVPGSGAYEPDKADIKIWTQEVERYLDNAVSLGNSLLNGKVVFTASGGIGTVAIQTMAGASPSAADPVYLVLRGAGDSDGDFDIYVLTAATTLTVNSGATLGAVNNQPLRVWITGIGDGATFRLGVINCFDLTSGVAQIFGLRPHQTVTTVAMGTGADSAGVMYANAIASTKAFAVLGFATWTAGLATAGTWTTPSSVVQMSPETPLPGTSVQRVRKTDSAVASGATTMALDDTIPQNTEGNQFFSQAITPSHQANILRVKMQMYLASSAAGHLIMALFNSATGANALAAVASRTDAAGDNLLLALEYLMIAGQVTALTFTGRAGNSGAATTTFNGSAAARLFGGVANSFIEIEELMG